MVSLAVNFKSFISKLAAATLMGLLLFLGPVHADVITVCASGCNYANITEAIDAARPGDIIEVQSGTYQENVNVTKRLMLRGVDTGEGIPVVDAGHNESAITLSAEGISIDGFIVTNSYMSYENIWSGIKVNSNNNIITNNTARTNENGIWVYNSDNNKIASNYVTDNNYGIRLEASNNNTIQNNSIISAKYGIKLVRSAHNNLNANNLSDSNYGIHLLGSEYNNITGNNASENEFGINLTASTNNTLRNNSIFSNEYNFGAGGANDIDVTNLANKRPIYYLVNVSGEIVNSSSNASTVYCIDCENITVMDLTLDKNLYGIRLENAKNSRIKNNSLINNVYGILVIDNSSNIVIENNTAENNRHDGIRLKSTFTSAIVNNSIIENDIGIKLESSKEIDISGNNISNNDIGIYNESSIYAEKDNILINNNKDQYTHEPIKVTSIGKFPDEDDTSPEPDRVTPTDRDSSRHPYTYSETTITEETPQIESTDLEKLAEEASGCLMFNPPTEMWVGIGYWIDARIAKENTTRLIEDLMGKGEPQYRDINVTANMSYRVSLTGEEEKFKIRADRPEVQILGEDPAVWLWYVTPLKEGNGTLILYVDVVVDHCKYLNVTSWPVQIRLEEMSYTDRMKYFIMNYWQWIIGIIISSGVIKWLIGQIKSRKSAKSIEKTDKK